MACYPKVILSKGLAFSSLFYIFSAFGAPQQRPIDTEFYEAQVAQMERALSGYAQAIVDIEAHMAQRHSGDTSISPFLYLLHNKKNCFHMLFYSAYQSLVEWEGGLEAHQSATIDVLAQEFRVLDWGPRADVSPQ